MLTADCCVLLFYKIRELLPEGFQPVAELRNQSYAKGAPRFSGGGKHQ